LKNEWTFPEKGSGTPRAGERHTARPVLGIEGSIRVAHVNDPRVDHGNTDFDRGRLEVTGDKIRPRALSEGASIRGGWDGSVVAMVGGIERRNIPREFPCSP